MRRMRGTRFIGSARTRSRSKSARRPLCANLIAVIVSCSGTIDGATTSLDTCEPIVRSAARFGADPATGAVSRWKRTLLGT